MIADVSIGGTYITMLNAGMNIGSLIPNSLVMYLIPVCSIRMYMWESGGSGSGGVLSWVMDSLYVYVYHRNPLNTVGMCSDTVTNDCYYVQKVDGFVVLSVISSIVGVLWMIRVQPVLQYLQSRDRKDWIVNKKRLQV